MRQLIFLLSVLSFLITGCLVQEEIDPDVESTELGENGDGTEKETDNGSNDNCGGVTDEQQAVGDSLVELANASAVHSLELMVDSEDWEDMKNNAPNDALTLYDEALELAPGHCGALFGKTVTSMLVMSQDQELNDFMDDFQATQDKYGDEDDDDVNTVADVMTMSPENSPALLLATSARIAETDEVQMRDLQLLIESTFLPEVDDAIERLSTILYGGEFEFEFVIEEGTRDEQTIQVDKGEIGPLLAGLRVFRTFLITILAHELDFSKNGSYDWMGDLFSIDDPDFDNLDAGQTAALDHFTSFFDRDAEFTTIREDYAAKYEQIPEELLQALKDLKKGFEYGIEESESVFNTQRNDPYVVGTSEDADLNPYDLQKAIDQLDHFEKYFTGEVAISYSKGSKTLKVNFPKAFQRTGNMQQYLPYFAFYPYEEWNDTISVDTNFAYLTKYDKTYWYDECEELEDNPDYTHKCFSHHEIDVITKGPFYFTDAVGTKTIALYEFDDIEEATDLTGKIVYPDPTVGGIFPNLTNDNVFEYIGALEDVQPYEAMSCRDIFNARGDWIDERCTVRPLPENPSDLDRLAYIIANFLD